MLLRKVVEKIKTHISRSLFLFYNCLVSEIMWKDVVDRDRHRWQYCHAHCMLDN